MKLSRVNGPAAYKTFHESDEAARSRATGPPVAPHSALPPARLSLFRLSPLPPFLHLSPAQLLPELG